MAQMLIDLNQVIIANLMRHMKEVATSTKVDEDLVRHMSLNTIRAITKHFKSQYDDIVLCCDSRHHWRRDYFPFYKAHRKGDRDASGYDWNMIFETINKLRDELRENSPYKVIEVEGAEADDIIATLATSTNNKVLVVSSDKDFLQLQRYDNVKQYAPIQGKFLTVDDPEAYLKEHILRGDRGDGVPNFLSADDTFVTGERQKVLNKKRMDTYMATDEFETENMRRGFKRNQTLIDFEYIPERIRTAILDAYEAARPATYDKLLNYFMDKGLKYMIENASDF